MKALKPTTPRPASCSSLSRLSGVRPPHMAKSVWLFCAAAWRLASKLGQSRAGGAEFSGMSKKQVPPPAASADEPVSKPSQSVRPGSLKWTWWSMRPGNRCRPVASISSRAWPVMDGESSAGLVEVDVGVGGAWEEVQGRGVDFVAGLAGDGWGEFGDALVFDGDVEGGDAVGGDDLGVSDDEVEGHRLTASVRAVGPG